MSVSVCLGVARGRAYAYGLLRRAEKQRRNLTCHTDAAVQYHTETEVPQDSCLKKKVIIFHLIGTDVDSPQIHLADFCSAFTAFALVQDTITKHH